MTDALAILKSLRRPRLLTRAAHIGLEDYNRDRSLRRLIPAPGSPESRQVLEQLVEQEAEADQCRREGSASYSPAHHIELLVALIAEARLVTAMRGA